MKITSLSNNSKPKKPMKSIKEKELNKEQDLIDKDDKKTQKNSKK